MIANANTTVRSAASHLPIMRTPTPFSRLDPDLGISTDTATQRPYRQPQRLSLAQGLKQLIIGNG